MTGPRVDVPRGTSPAVDPDPLLEALIALARSAIANRHAALEREVAAQRLTGQPADPE